MSSKSTQQPAALRLIEYCVEHLDEQTQYMMMPALNEPLRETDHEKRLAELSSEKATLQTRLAAADEMALPNCRKHLRRWMPVLSLKRSLGRFLPKV